MLKWEDLICSDIWMVQPASSAVNIHRWSKREVKQDLATQYFIYKTITDHQPNLGASK
ncbi:MAG: hypothetical protein DSM106950_11775 [Stigonema ocellatum SAG 48.90 = DSM 106950]|nr:hypothetical protein [Stigonema ocellatum SAG 48.90 = DSM 106950]